MSVLVSAIFNISSLNALHDSNRPCSLDFGEDFPIFDRPFFSICNTPRDAELNRKVKLIGSLKNCSLSSIALEAFGTIAPEATPINIMPMLFVFLQGQGVMDLLKYSFECSVSFHG